MALHRFGTGRVDPLVRLMLRHRTGVFVVQPGAPQPPARRKPAGTEFRIQGSPTPPEGPT